MSALLGHADGVVCLHEPDDFLSVPFAARARVGLGAFPVVEPGTDAPPEYQRLWDVAFTTRGRSLSNPLARWIYTRVPDRDKVLATVPDASSPLLLRIAMGLAAPAYERPGTSGRVIKSVDVPMALEWLIGRYGPQVVLVNRHPLDVLASRIELEAVYLQELELGYVDDRGVAPRIERWGGPERPTNDPIASLAWFVGFEMSAYQEVADAHPEVIVVDHALLCQDPVVEFRRLVSELGFGWTADCQDYLQASDTPGTGFQTKRVTSEQAGKWRTRLSEDQVRSARRRPHPVPDRPAIPGPRGLTPTDVAGKRAPRRVPPGRARTDGHGHAKFDAALDVTSFRAVPRSLMLGGPRPDERNPDFPTAARIDSLMSTDMVTVVLAADNEYAMPLTVAARSVIATLDPARRLRICVLDMGIDEDNRRTVELSLQHPRVEVLWVDTLHDRVAHFPNTWPKITRAGYARIYVPEVLSEVDRALYLDCDVVVRRDVAALSECEMGGNLAMGVQDVQAPFVPFGVPQWFEAGRSAGEVNFNSGVLLMDLGAWRRERVTQELVDYLTGARYLRAQDQEGINAVIGSRIGSLDPRWNQQAEIFWEGLRYHYEAFLPCDRDDRAAPRPQGSMDHPLLEPSQAVALRVQSPVPRGVVRESGPHRVRRLAAPRAQPDGDARAEVGGPPEAPGAQARLQRLSA